MNNIGIRIEFDGASAGQVQKKVRVRNPTLLKMQWLAERVRKCERIKREVAEGRYAVDSREIAKSILNLPAFK